MPRGEEGRRRGEELQRWGKGRNRKANEPRNRTHRVTEYRIRLAPSPDDERVRFVDLDHSARRKGGAESKVRIGLRRGKGEGRDEPVNGFFYRTNGEFDDKGDLRSEGDRE
jgi:hypothetical protein